MRVLIVRSDDAVPFAERNTETGFRSTDGPENVCGDTVALRAIVPEKSLKLNNVIIDLPTDPGIKIRLVGLARTEKSGVVLNACTASPIESQGATAVSLNVTAVLLTVALTTLYSTCSFPGPKGMRENPGPAVGKQQLSPCVTPAKIMSLALLVETWTDVLPLESLAVPGKALLGSNGSTKFAPLIPKTTTVL